MPEAAVQSSLEARIARSPIHQWAARGGIDLGELLIREGVPAYLHPKLDELLIARGAHHPYRLSPRSAEAFREKSIHIMGALDITLPLDPDAIAIGVIYGKLTKAWARHEMGKASLTMDPASA